MLSRVHGQPEGVAFLKRVIEGQLTSPLLLVGREGVGRKFSVLETARHMFGPEPHHTIQLNKGVHPDFVLVEREGGKDLGIESSRKVRESTQSFPTLAPYRFFVIDGVDHITNPAANALLKVLEEPPSHTRFFLLAENYSCVLPTIRSRCGRVRYAPLDETFIVESLGQHETNEVKARVYTRLADGSLGVAKQYSYSGKLILRNRVFGLLRFAQSREVSKLFSEIDDLADVLDLVFKFYGHLVHDLFVVQATPELVSNLDLVDSLLSVASGMSPDQWTRLRVGYQRLNRIHGSSVNFPFQFKSHLLMSFQ